MNLIMFIVGFTIFFLYIIGLLYMINRSHNEQKEDVLNKFLTKNNYQPLNRPQTLMI